MNYHLLSFIVDCFSWVVGAYLFGQIVIREGNVKHRKQKLLLIKIIVIAFIGGLHATMNYALPDYGFAVTQFFFAMLYPAVYVCISVTSFRKAIEQKFMAGMQHSLRVAKRGGELYGNNR